MKIKSLKFISIFYRSLAITLIFYLISLIWSSEITSIIFFGIDLLYHLSFLLLFLIIILLIILVNKNSYYQINNDKIIKYTNFIIRREKEYLIDIKKISFIKKKSLINSLFKLTRVKFINNNGIVFNLLMNDKELIEFEKIFIYNKEKEPYKAKTFFKISKTEILFKFIKTLIYLLIVFGLILLFLSLINLTSFKIQNIYVLSFILSCLFIILYWIFYMTTYSNNIINIDKNIIHITQGLLIRSEIILNKSLIRTIKYNNDLISKLINKYHYSLYINNKFTINISSTKELMDEIISIKNIKKTSLSFSFILILLIIFSLYSFILLLNSHIEFSIISFIFLNYLLFSNVTTKIFKNDNYLVIESGLILNNKIIIDKNSILKISKINLFKDINLYEIITKDFNNIYIIKGEI